MLVGGGAHMCFTIDIFHKKPHLLEGVPFEMYSGAL